MSNNPKGTMTYDNVAVTQAYDPIAAVEYEKLGKDDSLIDFDYKNDDYTPNVTSPNTYKIVTDPVTGDSYIEYSKTGGKSGGSIRTNVTEVQDKANVAVIEFDFYACSDTTKLDAQVTAGYTGNNNSGIPTNTTTPFFIQPHISQRDQWVRIRIEYRVLEITNGKVSKVQTDVYINDVYQKSGFRVAPDAATGVYKNGSTKFEIFGGGSYQVPTVDILTTVTFSLNQACNGTFRYDNISYRLIHVDGMDPTVVTTE